MPVLRDYCEETLLWLLSFACKSSEVDWACGNANERGRRRYDGSVMLVELGTHSASMANVIELTRKTGSV